MSVGPAARRQLRDGQGNDEAGAAILHEPAMGIPAVATFVLAVVSAFQTAAGGAFTVVFTCEA